jgi:hypothetical protein
MTLAFSKIIQISLALTESPSSLGAALVNDGFLERCAINLQCKDRDQAPACSRLTLIPRVPLGRSVSLCRHSARAMLTKNKKYQTKQTGLPRLQNVLVIMWTNCLTNGASPFLKPGSSRFSHKRRSTLCKETRITKRARQTMKFRSRQYKVAMVLIASDPCISSVLSHFLVLHPHYYHHVTLWFPPSPYQPLDAEPLDYYTLFRKHRPNRPSAWNSLSINFKFNLLVLIVSLADRDTHDDGLRYPGKRSSNTGCCPCIYQLGLLARLRYRRLSRTVLHHYCMAASLQYPTLWPKRTDYMRRVKRSSYLDSTHNFYFSLYYLPQSHSCRSTIVRVTRRL